MANSVRSSPIDEGAESGDYDDDYLYRLSGEETEDASESEFTHRRQDMKEFTEIKEQMYMDKLEQFRKQLQQLQDGTLPEYLRRLKRIEQQYKERLRMNDIENAEHCYQSELEQNRRDYDLKKIDLKESLIADWEEKKRKVENDKLHMELSADFIDFKPITTRKLRRRLNPDGNTNTNCGTQEKRRKQSPTYSLLLDEAAINEDLKIINKVSGKPISNRSKPQPSSSTDDQCSYDARIEDGKLYFEKRWYLRGQAIYADSKESGKFGATISSITSSEVWIRKTSDNSKVKIQLSQLQRGKYVIRRRST